MQESRVPITTGSRRARSEDTGTCRITEAWFPPGSVLHPHRHDRHILAIMLGGAFETRIARRRLDCAAGTVWTEPCEEPHANFVGSGGAHVVVVQPQAGAADLGPFDALLDAVWATPDPVIASDALRIAAEVAAPDSLSAITLDALVVIICARAARMRARVQSGRAPPSWLERAREFVHAHHRGSPTLSQVAAAADVPAWHLAREFRRYFRASIGEYARALRLTWAVEQLGATDTPISEIALQAGFTDQSHFNRACRSATGLAPLAYRRRVRERLAPSPR